MAKPLEKAQNPLYERDFFSWTQEQAVRLRARSHNDVDWENLAEEIESVGRSDKREIRNRMSRLLQHLLKWQFQPGRRSESWKSSISEQRLFIAGIIEDSPSLKGYPAEVFDDVYAVGRGYAIDDTGLPGSIFPTTPPFGVGQALDPKFLPGEPFDNWAVIRD